MEQRERTVGHCSFDEEQFQRSTEQSIRLLLAFMSKHDVVAKRILDVGCGVGRISSVLIPFFQEVYGIDISLWAVERARQNHSRGNFQTYNGERMPFEDGYFGTCLSWTVLQHIPPQEIEGVCGEIARVMEPKGRLILYENVSSIPDKKHIWYRSVKSYWELFKGFELKVAEVIDGADGNSELHTLMLLRKP